MHGSRLHSRKRIIQPFEARLLVGRKVHGALFPLRRGRKPSSKRWSDFQLKLDPTAFRAIVRNKSISHGAFRLWHCLFHYADDKGVCWPGYRTLANEIGCKQHSLAKWIDELCLAGLLEFQAKVKGCSTRYRLRGAAEKGSTTAVLKSMTTAAEMGSETNPILSNPIELKNRVGNRPWASLSEALEFADQNGYSRDMIEKFYIWNEKKGWPVKDFYWALKGFELKFRAKKQYPVRY